MTWKERKTQEKIYKWIKEGREVKVGYARVKVDGKWRDWEEIEKDMARKEMVDIDKVEEG